MPEFVFTGRLTLRGVDFFIEAETLEEAERLALTGAYGFHETAGSVVTDIYIDATTGQENA
jgi:hypothetical protein